MGTPYRRLATPLVRNHYFPNLPSQDLRKPAVAIARIGPEKGIIHIATGAVGNAIWDMFARSKSKPLWKLIVDMTPVRSSVSLHAGEIAS